MNTESGIAHVGCGKAGSGRGEINPSVFTFDRCQVRGGGGSSCGRFVVLFSSCRVLCCSCCVFVCVTCFSSYRAGTLDRALEVEEYRYRPLCFILSSD